MSIPLAENLDHRHLHVFFLASLPAIRACIFDMDGLLINSEDMLTLSVNLILEKYGRPPFTQSIRAQMMGVPGSIHSDLFHDWAKLPISRQQFSREAAEQMQLHFPNCTPLPGAEDILSNLTRARSVSSGDNIELALASGTTGPTYSLKTARPETKQLLSYFDPDRRVLGDDPRVPKGRGKPAPDIYLVALQSLNATKHGPDSSTKPIMPNECLVFEDSVVGVEAARRAGMRVVWIPHPSVAAEYQTRQKETLAGSLNLDGVGDGWQHQQIEDGWAESISSLEHFNYGRYGIEVPS